MKIQDILARKGREVVTIAPESSVTDAVRLLVERGIGSLLVVEKGEIRGIITERDVLRLTHRDPGALAATSVAETMTRDLIVCLPHDDVHYVMDTMTRNRVRHLPVVEEDDALYGIISIGDVVNAIRRDIESENRYLKDYVRGMVR